MGADTIMQDYQPPEVEREGEGGREGGREGREGGREGGRDGERERGREEAVAYIQGPPFQKSCKRLYNSLVQPADSREKSGCARLRLVVCTCAAIYRSGVMQACMTSFH